MRGLPRPSEKAHSGREVRRRDETLTLSRDAVARVWRGFALRHLEERIFRTILVGASPQKARRKEDVEILS